MSASFPPHGSCDCHVHVIGPKSRFPLAPRRSYTPMDASVGDLESKLAELGVDRVVVVQPSIYGTDNDCLVDALRVLGDRARGVAVVDASASAAELDQLHAAGVRGLRVNLVSSGRVQLADARAHFAGAVRHCVRNGWHVQVFLTPDLLESMLGDFRDLPVPIVIDHFGLIPAGASGKIHLRALGSLLESGKAWVKLSAPYRIARDVEDPAIASLARALAAINSDRLIWGTDWPHTPVHSGKSSDPTTETPYRDIATTRLLSMVTEWFPETGMQARILTDNPARLYGWI